MASSSDIFKVSRVPLSILVSLLKDELSPMIRFKKCILFLYCTHLKKDTFSLCWNSNIYLPLNSEVAMGSRERALTAVGDGLGFVSSTGFPDELIERLRIRLLFSLSWTCVRL